MIHIYTGDGKGKTTAAVGLAVRCAGHGENVLFTQFLKDGTSGECYSLSKCPHIELMLPQKSFGFTFHMDEQTRQQAAEYYKNLFLKVCEQYQSGEYRMLILDEIIGACNTGMVEEEILCSFLDTLDDKNEVVLTGRNPSKHLCTYADYITEMKKIRHPFDKNIAARTGIEL